jgi:hypothetical protein
MTDDRATEQSLIDFLSDAGSGGPGEAMDGSGGAAVVADGKPARIRNLRATFRSVPASTPGFPGTRSFTPRRPDRRETGAAIEAARVGPDPASAAAQGSGDPARRNTAVSRLRAAAAAIRSGEPAGEGAEGRRVCGRAAAGSRTAAAGRRGRPVGSGKKAKQVETGPTLPKAIAKLIPKDDTAPPVTAKLVPTESERANATRLFRQIGETFNVNRKKSKTAAYAAYRHDLMANLDTLIMGGAIDLKEVTTVITNLEQYTKETEAESTETPATILGRWLRMEPGEVAELEVPAIEIIDANDQSVEDEKEESEESVVVDSIE